MSVFFYSFSTALVADIVIVPLISNGNDRLLIIKSPLIPLSSLFTVIIILLLLSLSIFNFWIGFQLIGIDFSNHLLQL